jgi:large subunit ribosomal protein L3
MVKGILGKKIGMTQFFNEEGVFIPVTVIQAGPCTVVQVKTPEKDGYRALQLGFEEKKPKRVTKPLRGHFEKRGVKPKKCLKEVPYEEGDQYAPGGEIDVSVLEKVKKVDIAGITKGRGFTGTVKRWGFGRGPESHGSKNVREPGSTGQHTFPARVFKGKKMPGHLGAVRRMVRNLEVVKIIKERNLLLVKGGVPGPRGGYLEIRPSLTG